MAVKVGDIVHYDNQTQRIMAIDDRCVTLSISGSIFFPDLSVLDTVHLEIVKLPQFKVGDLFYVNSIPDSEKRNYGPRWLNSMDAHIGQILEVRGIRTSAIFGPVVIISGQYEFQTYHLELVHQYDII